MIRSRLISLTIALTLLVLSVMVVNAQDGMTIDMLRVRTGPSTDDPIMTRIPPHTDVVIEGRNDIGNWILIHTSDNTVRGWVASPYVVFNEGVSLAMLPVTDERLSAPPAPEATAPTPTTTDTASNLPPTTDVVGTTVSNLNLRQGPGTSNPVLVKLPQGSVLAVEARNNVGNWVLVQTSDGGARGWVATQYLHFEGAVNLSTLPVSTEIVSETEATAPVVTRELPAGTPGEMRDELRNTPIFSNMTSRTVYTIYETGKSLGNRSQVFMKVGDSVTATQPFLLGFGNGDYNLGAYSILQPTIDWFNAVSPRVGVPNSFVNESLAARNGFISGAVFDVLWSDPTVCDEGPLYCEYNAIHPSVAIILFGAQDMRLVDAKTFQNNMYRIVLDLKDRGVIPVLNTFGNHPDYVGDNAALFNMVIVDLARDQDVPLINLWRATQELPDYGINIADPVHLTQGNTYFSFNGEESQYGVTLRNLLTLQALDELRRNVLTR